MNTEIHRADPHMRRRTLVVMSAAVVVAILSLAWFRHWLDRSTLATPVDLFVLEMRRMIGITGMGCGLCLLLLAGYMARLARRVTEERRWPLKSSRVVLDTHVRYGEAAFRFARLLNVVAIVLIVLAIGVGLAGWRAFGVL